MGEGGREYALRVGAGVGNLSLGRAGAEGGTGMGVGIRCFGPEGAGGGTGIGMGILCFGPGAGA